MKNKRIFIGWNGEDNREIARKVSNLLSSQNYSPIVGGEKKEYYTVNEEITQQMNSCDYAIFLIEKETKKDKNGTLISMGLNPNVMMELGYMLHKVSEHNRIRRILINMQPGELPSDLQGTWSKTVEKDSFDAENPEEKDRAFSNLAQEVVDDFFEYVQKAQHYTNKLDYFDNWEENVREIYKFTGNERIADKLIFGMQSAIYSGEFDRLYKKLIDIKNLLSQKDQFDEYSIVKCAMAILNVFVVTRRLTHTPDEEQFSSLCEDLDFEYEKDIKDPDLRAWCEIFRYDKLELCYEMYADGQSGTERIDSLKYALELCHAISSKIATQVSAKKEDEGYALIYRAFINRNISQIHKKLAEMEPSNAQEHLELQKEYCAKTLENRSQLYEYYKGSSRENSLAMDYISQEYLLALAEQSKFEESEVKKAKIARTVKTIYKQWKDRNEIRNMIFSKVTEEASQILNLRN